MMVDKVIDILYKLYNFYSSIHSPNVQEQSGSERTELESDASDPYVMVHSQYEHFLQVEQSVGCSNELEKYLAENCDGRKDAKFGIFGWWSDNCSRYQALSKVAKDVLYLFPLLHLSQHLAPEVALLIHFKVHSLLSWFKSLYVHEIGFKLQFQFLTTSQGIT